MAFPTNDFDVWDNDNPVVSATADPDFNIWYDGVPVVDIDEGGQGTLFIRRRISEF